MINLALRSEYSFKRCYGFISKIAQDQEHAVGIADDDNTYGHFQLQKVCSDRGMKPIFGVRLMVIEKQMEKVKSWGPRYIFLAKTQSGLSEIYALVKRAYDRFYYHPVVTYADIEKLSSNVIVIAPNFVKPNRVDYIGLCHTTPRKLIDHELPKVAINLNWYMYPDDRQVYELHAGDRLMETQTYPQHILSDAEWYRIWGDYTAIENTYAIANMCEHVTIPIADMVKFKGNLTLRNLCRAGARKRKIDIESEPYKSRLARELDLIYSKDFADYFLIVSDMCRKAKRKMLVGPSRGSSAGSIVCYLTEITEVDPIKFDLLFERFVDVNRADLPDIDIDFPDVKRHLVIKELVGTYGRDHVTHVGTVATMKPRSAIGQFAAGLGIPAYETDAVKDAIIDRSGGDARAQMRIEDTFETTDVGREFIKQFPSMNIVKFIEGHASHAGKHAAGLVVCNEPLTTYGGINSREDVMMLDKNEIESLGLLKIDCLGLRTLSVLESVADQIGMPYADYYKLPLDDKKALGIFNDMRLSGIFQFQGNALQYVTRQMGVHSFDDIAAITALARPGPIHSGGTNTFISRRTGQTPVEYLSQHPSVIRHTEATYGVIIYQEQLMSIGREYGGLSWEDVSALRKAASKSLGEEWFNRYKGNFVSGALAKGADEAEAVKVWESMVTFGSWGFNKSHAYGYGLISYWTAWAKAHYPSQFAVANLNHARSEDSALKILRDMVTNDGIEYIALDPDNSDIEWSVNSDGKLLGGLLSLKGIGVKKAREIIRARNHEGKWTPSMIKALRHPQTIFSILFPCKHYWGELYEKPEEFGLVNAPVNIEEISKPGDYLFIGKLVDNNLRDLNETQSVAKRGGEILTEHTLFLNMILEDDTDSIVCTINRFDFERIGRKIAESGKVGEHWYLVKGKIKDKWRRVQVEEILCLNEWSPENLKRPAPNLMLE